MNFRNILIYFLKKLQFLFVFIEKSSHICNGLQSIIGNIERHCAVTINETWKISKESVTHNCRALRIWAWSVVLY
jgi:hypothetical protein